MRGRDEIETAEFRVSPIRDGVGLGEGRPSRGGLGVETGVWRAPRSEGERGKEGSVGDGPVTCRRLLK